VTTYRSHFKVFAPRSLERLSRNFGKGLPLLMTQKSVVLSCTTVGYKCMQSHSKRSNISAFFCHFQGDIRQKNIQRRLITLVDLQLNAQSSYLFTYNTFIKILYMFRALPCSCSGGIRRNCIYMQPLVSSLCKK
jgi:hypothetical protein